MTGADSGIGRAVAIAFAREGADVLISYLSEHGKAEETARRVQDSGRRAVLVRGDVSSPEHCQNIVKRAVEAFGKVDVLVNKAAFQMSHESLENVPDEEWDHTIATTSRRCSTCARRCLPTMGPGSSIHRELVGELRHAESDACPLLGNRGSESRASAPVSLSCSALAGAGPTASRLSDLDPAHLHDDARGQRGAIRLQHRDRPPRSASWCRSRSCWPPATEATSREGA